MYPELKNKVYTMKEYVNYDRQYHDKINIKDPWGYDIETYRSCLAEIDEVLDLLIKKNKAFNTMPYYKLRITLSLKLLKV